MELFYVLLVLLILARLFAETAVRLGQPELLGEILAGILLGLVVHRYQDFFPILAGLDDTGDSVLAAVKDLGIFFLLLMGGLELRPREMAKTSAPAVLIAVGGIAVPFLLGWGLGSWFLPDSTYKTAQIIFLGTALSVTAVPVAIKVLMDLNRLETRAGRVIVSAAVIDDVLSLVLLAVLTSVVRTGTMPGGIALLALAGKVVLFFVVTTLIGHFLFPLLGRALHRARADEFELSSLLITSFAFALLSERLGMHFILGAFQAGLFFGRHTVDRAVYRQIQGNIKGLTNGFLAPVFFASIGLHLDLTSLMVIPGFVILLTVAASVGKVVGTGLTARMLGFDNKDAAAIGIAMNARGAVELVIADIALRAGVFSHPSPPPPLIAQLYSAVVVMAVVTTLVTPPLLRFVMRRRRHEG